MQSLYLALLWMLYYFLHSALAANGVKEFLSRHFPSIVKSYRFLYSFFAVTNFLLLGWLHTLVKSHQLFSPNQITLGISILLVWTGVGILTIAIKSYPLAFWISDREAPKLIRSGLNAWVRHPLYLGTLFFLIGFFLGFPSLKNALFVGISILYLIIGTLLEEQKLLKTFGREYAEYRESVKMLIPFIF